MLKLVRDKFTNFCIKKLKLISVIKVQFVNLSFQGDLFLHEKICQLSGTRYSTKMTWVKHLGLSLCELCYDYDALKHVLIHRTFEDQSFSEVDVITGFLISICQIRTAEYPVTSRTKNYLDDFIYQTYRDRADSQFFYVRIDSKTILGGSNAPKIVSLSR